MTEKTNIRRTALETINDLLNKNKMPSFFMFSTLDKNLLRYMLIKATEIEDEEIEGLRV